MLLNDLQSENKFLSVFENSLSAILLGKPDGSILEANHAALEMFGYNLDEMQSVGRTAIFDHLDPGMILALEKRKKDGHAKGEIIGIRKNGERFPCEFTSVIFKTENGESMTSTVLNDITAKKNEEHRLKLLESVITNTKDSVMITEAEPFDEPGPKIVYVNDAFTKMTGYEASEVIGKSPRILQGKNTNKEELKRLSEAMRKWESCEVTIINYKKNGEEFWINFSITPVADEKGWYTHWIAIERDVTHIKLGELEREQIISELSQNNTDLKQFSYVTSHNLRAPIANLLGLTSLIEQYNIPDKSLEQILGGIKQAALMFDDTVKDLTKVLVIKDQKGIVKEQIDLDRALEKVMTQLNLTCDGEDLSVNYDFTNCPCVCFTHAYLESVLLNLFTNAVKYKSASRKLKIDIKSMDSGDFVELRFSDNGIGIDTDLYKDKLFKLYQRFHDQSEGKGLGLYLVKSQLEALDGLIDIESKVGSGTTFIIKFRK
ncbi:MAG: sensor histidine kinase [Bacteroidetes bacterium]|jgi:PAS domain S-box-containing protein|nr:sensor histidine kinase [Bacteroidota bacterium]MDF2452738.1 sensor histidine kinase [Bacteroidota bacterium]